MPVSMNDNCALTCQSRKVLTVYSGMIDSGWSVILSTFSIIQVTLVFHDSTSPPPTNGTFRLPSTPRMMASGELVHWNTWPLVSLVTPIRSWPATILSS
ncbi:hypothetical protein D3C81_2036590 [compost metagenome]